MLLPMQRIKTGSLACWVLLIIIADLTDARVIFFKFRYDIRLYIRNYGKTVEDFVIFGNFFLQTASDITKPFAAQMYGIEILRSDRYGKNQSITNCTSFDDTIKALSMPFSVIYSEFFVIKGLKFNKDDTVFSKNLKFDFMTNNVQLNLSKILEHKDREFTDYSNETTIMGLCELKYDVKSYPESEDISFDGIKKTYTGVCEETMSPDNQYTLGNICSTGKMKNFRVKVTNECCIKLNQGMSTIMYTRLKHQRSFRPWKSSQRVLVAEYTIKMDYQYTLRRDLLPELQDATNELVDKPILTKPNPEVLKIKNSNLSNLVEDARALGCDASFETGTRELVEEVLKCYLPK